GGLRRNKIDATAGDGVAIGLAGWGDLRPVVDRVDVDIDLLPDVETLATRVEFINDLQDAGVDALGVLPGEGAFGDDVRLYSDEFQGKFFLGGAFKGSPGLGTWLESRDVMLVDIDTDMQLVDVSQHD